MWAVSLMHCTALCDLQWLKGQNTNSQEVLHNGGASCVLLHRRPFLGVGQAALIGRLLHSPVCCCSDGADVWGSRARSLPGCCPRAAAGAHRSAQCSPLEGACVRVVTRRQSDALTCLLVCLGSRVHGTGIRVCGAVASTPLPLVLSIPLQRVSLGALCVVAAYDGWQARRLALESGAAAAKAKELTSQLLAGSE